MESIFLHKEYSEQIEIFKSRNMIFGDDKQAEITLSRIPYYKIKEFGRPFCRKIESGIDYQKKSFEDILSRYYQDKNLRIQLLHALEDIEVCLKTQVSYVLSRRGQGAYSYLSFAHWCDKKEYCKHYLELKEQEYKSVIKKALSRQNNAEINEKLRADRKKYPPIWLSVDLLTFGQVVNLIELMSKSNKKYIADFFECTNIELISWLKCVNLIRNICAHNSNFIDTKLTTTPIIKEEWKNILYQHQSNVYSNRIALPLLIILHMIRKINNKYKSDSINLSLYKLINNDVTAQYYGFVNKEIFQNIFKLKKYNKRRHQ